MKEKMLSKRAEGYIDLCVGVLAFVMILVIAINIFSFISIKQDMDRIAEELLEAATFSGAFADEFFTRHNELCSENFNYYLYYEAEEYYNSVYQRVQLGDLMTVRVELDTYIKGLGVFKIPVTLGVTRSGLSERYWK